MNVSTTANTAVPFVSALSEVLTKHIQHQPERIAIGTSDLQTTITYGQLETRAIGYRANVQNRVEAWPYDRIAIRQ